MVHRLARSGRVTRLGAGGGGIVLQPSGLFSNTSGGSDYTIEVELSNSLAFRWAVYPGSAGGSEQFIFNNNPVTDYAQGAGAPNLTGLLPWNGTWSNGNNGATSGLGFDASNTLTFRTNGVAGAGSSFSIDLRDVPTLAEEGTCDRTESLLEYVDQTVTFQQSGRAATVGGTVVVNFPIPFADNDTAILLTAGIGANVNVVYELDSATGFTARAFDGAGAASDTSFSWLAVGTRP